jgi:hypothetical protein
MEKWNDQALSAAPISAAMLATPAIARESGIASRPVAQEAGARTAPDLGYIEGQLCHPAPRVGAFATHPGDSAPPCEPTPY